MQLLKLTDDIIANSNKRIKVIRCSDGYLKELNDKYAMSCRIELCQGDYRKCIGQDCLMVIAVDYYREVFENVCNDIGTDVDCLIYYFANKETEYEEYYRNKYKTYKLENIIIFRSGPHIDSYIKGMDFTDNSRALFEYMIKEKYNLRYKMVWFVKDREEYIGKYCKIDNVEFVNLEWSQSELECERDSYYYYLCLAKYIFFTDAYGIARNSRDDQIRVQLWHGCGFKTRLNFQPCNRRYEYMTVTSRLYADIHKEVFGLDDKQMLITGLPKEDWLSENAKKRIEEVIDNDYDKLILWLPTYRKADDILEQNNGYCISGYTGLPILDTYEKIQRVNGILRDNNICMLIKLHPFQDKRDINVGEYSNIRLLDNDVLVEKDIHINQLLGGIDAIISDYSSVAVDYMLLDRPIGFTVDDMGEYLKKRGFIFDNIEEWLPGVILKDEIEVIKYIDNVANCNDVGKEKRNRLKSLFHDNCSGSNCKRLLDTLGIINE